MDSIRISLLGKLQIQHSSHGIIKLKARRDQELLCYLLLNRKQLHDREKLATLMWEESSTAQSKRNLRQTLWHVQSLLNSCASENKILLIENGWIGINQNTQFWLDVAEIENAFALLETAGNTPLTQTQVAVLEQAVQVYQGDLFAGCYQDWCIYERERLQMMYLAILDYLLSHSEEQREYESGLYYGAQILRYDRAREQTHRQLMRIYYSMGNRSAAIHQYELCALALREELGVAPAQNTEALHQIIRCQETTRHQAEAISTDRVYNRSKLLEESTLHQLEYIQSTLAYLQEQVSDLILAYK